MMIDIAPGSTAIREAAAPSVQLVPSAASGAIG